ncbi:MAG: enoyl-CoA hydratase-related protein [Rhodocyclaceae bacterium]|jgi:2-(1,2-epoxy-1,2-dihydrophenyl)acetyl-CoA isomerase|nr:enoyl-CoA hydratase-related protein [Rhodocyclaceae bacterium]
MSAYKSIDLTVSEGIARLTLNQPELGNPVNELFCDEWPHAINELASRKDVRAVLFSANGKFFSVGGDIAMFTQTLDQLPANILKWTVGFHAGMARLARIDAPVVAAVHATAVGGAVSMLAACDAVYCGRSVTLGSGYSLIGYSCDGGASVALSTRMGLARARRFILMGETLTAEEAERCGLVDFVVDDNAVLAEAEKRAARLAKGPTRAYGEIRRLFAKAFTQSLESQLEDEAQALSRMAGTADAREGLTAFMQKRKPTFTGN